MTTIFRASFTDPKTGKTYYARDYGLKGFPIRIRKPGPPKGSQPQKRK